jgi:hypothetical protein
MKLDAVYLVAPRPAIPSMPTRRAFCGMAATFVVGGACGYTLGVVDSSNGNSNAATVTPETKPATPTELPSTGDAELDYWRKLAVGPLDDLFARGHQFATTRLARYQTDEVLWSGVDRLTKEIVENPDRKTDPLLIMILASSIEGKARPELPSLRERVPALRARRKAEEHR